MLLLTGASITLVKKLNIIIFYIESCEFNALKV